MKYNEYMARLYLGEHDYKRYKTHEQELLSFKKTIKGKPTLEQAITLLNNQETLDWYATYLYHASNYDKCDCRECSILREGKYDEYFPKAPIQLDLFGENKAYKNTYEYKLNKILEKYG